jgi:dihydrofolate reductase
MKKLWENSTVLRGDLVEDVRALKEQSGGEIDVTGSVTLVHALIAAGFVDQYRLFLYLVVVGRGCRLFENATAVGKLELVEAQPFRSGIVRLTYRPRHEN